MATQTTRRHNRMEGANGANRTGTTRTQAEPESELELDPSVRNYIREREGARRIKLHEEAGKPAKLSDAVVRRPNGDPDLRFAENQNLFKRDKSKRADGKPDNRFVENRPEILDLHAQRGETRPNLVFADDDE